MSGVHGRIIEVRFIDCDRMLYTNLGATVFTAYRASEYLSLLTENGAIIPQASTELDHFYKTTDPEKTSENENTAPNASSPDLLLPKDIVPSLITVLGLRSSAAADFYRALEQAKTRKG